MGFTLAEFSTCCDHPLDMLFVKLLDPAQMLSEAGHLVYWTHGDFSGTSQHQTLSLPSSQQLVRSSAGGAPSSLAGGASGA